MLKQCLAPFENQNLFMGSGEVVEGGDGRVNIPSRRSQSFIQGKPITFLYCITWLQLYYFLVFYSWQVAELFTDNFDYQTRDDFVRGLLVNEEVRRGLLQGKTCYFALENLVTCSCLSPRCWGTRSTCM